MEDIPLFFFGRPGFAIFNEVCEGRIVVWSVARVSWILKLRCYFWRGRVKIWAVSLSIASLSPQL